MASRRPLILGHRGDPSRGSENTIASFDRALAAGADGIEFDVRPGRDALVVHHDATLRSRGRRLSIASLGADALPRSMPTAERVVDWARGNVALLDVEIKVPGIEREVLDLFRPVRSRCVFTSFHPDAVYAVREAFPDARTGWISKARPDAIELIASELGPHVIVLPLRRCGPALVRRLQTLGSEVWVWNVNTVGAAQRLQALGVAALITDRPGRLAAWRDGRAPRRTIPRTGRRES